MLGVMPQSLACLHRFSLENLVSLGAMMSTPHTIFSMGLTKGSSHTNNGITNYEQRYVSVLPLALVAVGVMMVPESTPLLLVGLKIFAK